MTCVSNVRNKILIIFSNIRIKKCNFEGEIDCYIKEKSISFLLVIFFGNQNKTIFSGCEQTLTESLGTFYSKNFPESYEEDTNCSWKIQVEENQKIELTFHFIDVSVFVLSKIP